MSDKGLFREQALIARQEEGTGSVVYYQPLTLKLLLILLVLAFFAFIVYASLADINQTVLVRGFVSTTDGEVKVYASRPGQLDSLHVQNGDVVHKAQVLASVVENGFDSEGHDIRLQSAQYLEEQIGQLSSRLALISERLLLQERLHRNRRQALDDELEVRQSEHDLAGWQLENARNEFSRLEQLNIHRAVSDSELAGAESGLLSMQKNRQVSQLSVNLVESQRNDLETQEKLENIRLLDERLALAFNLSQLRQRRDEMRLEHRYSLIAPVAGRVENLLNHSGDHLNSRQPVLSIVPLQPSYKAQLFLPSRALGKVAEGQTVNLIYDAYPLHEYGSFQARVASISATVIDPREYLIPLDVNEPVYLLQADLLPGHHTLALRPGMQFSAELMVGSQTILKSVLKPLRTLENRLK